MTLAAPGGSSLTLNNAFQLGGLLNFELPGAGNALTLTGPVSGSGSLYLKTGNGALVLTGANTYTGGTLLDSGVLGLGSDTAAGTNSIRVSGSGAIAAYGNVTVANNIRTSNTTGIDTRGFDMTLNGVIANDSGGPGAIEKVGAGTLVLTAASTYSGGTTVTGGTLQVDGSIVGDAVVGSGATLGGSGSVGGLVTVNSGGIINPGTAGTAGTLDVGDLFLDSGSILNLDLAAPSLLPGSGNDFIVVSGTATLNNATVNIFALPGFASGTYRVMTFTNLAPGRCSPPVVRRRPIAFTFDIGATYVDLLVAQSGVGPVQYWDGGDLAANGSVAGGNGTWNLGNTNWTTSDGNTNGAWGGGTGIFQTVGGTVSVAGTQLFENLTFSVDGYVLNGGNLQSNGSTIAVASIGNTATINSAIVGTNGLTKTGSGTLVIGGAATYTGDTNLNAGTLALTQNGFYSVGTGSINAANGTTLRADNGGQARVSNAVAIAGTLTVAGAGDLELDGVVSGGTLQKNGSGVLRLSNANTYSGGTLLNEGGIVYDGNGAFGTGALTMADNTGLFTFFNGLTIGNDIALTSGTATVGIVATSTEISGEISGDGALAKVNAGTLVLTGANTYTGGTQLDQGTLAFGNVGAFGTGGIAMANGTTIRSDVGGTVTNAVVITGTGNFNSNGNNNTLSGVISGGTLAKGGAGILTLTNVNTMSGLNIDAGTVAVTQAGALGTGTVSHHPARDAAHRCGDDHCQQHYRRRCCL